MDGALRLQVSEKYAVLAEEMAVGTGTLGPQAV